MEASMESDGNQEDIHPPDEEPTEAALSGPAPEKDQEATLPAAAEAAEAPEKDQEAAPLSAPEPEEDQETTLVAAGAAETPASNPSGPVTPLQSRAGRRPAFA